MTPHRSLAACLALAALAVPPAAAQALVPSGSTGRAAATGSAPAPAPPSEATPTRAARVVPHAPKVVPLAAPLPEPFQLAVEPEKVELAKEKVKPAKEKVKPAKEKLEPARENVEPVRVRIIDLNSENLPDIIGVAPDDDSVVIEPTEIVFVERAAPVAVAADPAPSQDVPGLTVIQVNEGGQEPVRSRPLARARGPLPTGSDAVLAPPAELAHPDQTAELTRPATLARPDRTAELTRPAALARPDRTAELTRPATLARPATPSRPATAARPASPSRPSPPVPAAAPGRPSTAAQQATGRFAVRLPDAAGSRGAASVRAQDAPRAQDGPFDARSLPPRAAAATPQGDLKTLIAAMKVLDERGYEAEARRVREIVRELRSAMRPRSAEERAAALLEGDIHDRAVRVGILELVVDGYEAAGWESAAEAMAWFAAIGRAQVAGEAPEMGSIPEGARGSDGNVMDRMVELVLGGAAVHQQAGHPRAADACLRLGRFYVQRSLGAFADRPAQGVAPAPEVEEPAAPRRRSGRTSAAEIGVDARALQGGAVGVELRALGYAGDTGSEDTEEEELDGPAEQDPTRTAVLRGLGYLGGTGEGPRLDRLRLIGPEEIEVIEEVEEEPPEEIEAELGRFTFDLGDAGGEAGSGSFVFSGGEGEGTLTFVGGHIRAFTEGEHSPDAIVFEQGEGGDVGELHWVMLHGDGEREEIIVEEPIIVDFEVSDHNETDTSSGYESGRGEPVVAISHVVERNAKERRALEERIARLQAEIAELTAHLERHRAELEAQVAERASERRRRR